MKIELVYDEDSKIDPIDVLGKIKLLKDGDCIEEDDTYLDSWLIGLAEGLHKIEKAESVLIDIVEEPNPIKMEKVNETVKISYKREIIELSDIEELRSALKNAAQDMLLRFKGEKGFNQNHLLIQISNL